LRLAVLSRMVLWQVVLWQMVLWQMVLWQMVLWQMVLSQPLLQQPSLAQLPPQQPAAATDLSSHPRRRTARLSIHSTCESPISPDCRGFVTRPRPQVGRFAAQFVFT
jgi:hypothetical protein